MHLLDVIVQVTLCSVLLVAPRDFALIRFLPCVEPEVRLEIALLKKRFSAVFDGTDVVSLSFVLVNVDLKTLLPSVGLMAVGVGTFERALLLMDSDVVFEMAFRHEGFIAPGVITDVRFVRSLQGLMKLVTYVNLLMLQ